MFWLRLLVFLAPAGVIAGSLWLAGQARGLVYRTDSDLVVAVRAAPRAGNPLAPATGATREITELIFDRLLGMDDQGRPQPHVATRWGYRHRATIFFATADAAAAAAKTINAAPDCWPDWQLISADPDGDRLHLITSDPRPGWPEPVVSTLGPAGLEDLLQVRLTLREAIQQSFGDFLSTSVEKSQIRHLRYRDDRSAEIYLRPGDTDQFLKELRLYYGSNPNLAPRIDEIGTVSSYAELEFEIGLRTDIRWHDGEPLTADDLIFTFEEVTRQGSPWPLRGAFDFVERVEKVDQHTVRARYRAYFGPALESWAKLPLLPAHRLRTAASQADWDAFFTRPVGSGPYRLESTWPDGGIVLGAHRDYFGGTPKQATIRYRVLPDARSRLRELKLGLIDVFQPDEAERRRAAQTSRATVVEDAPRYQSFVAWNVDRPLFRDPAMRRALARMIDLDALLSTIASGHAEPWPGLFFPGCWYAPAPASRLSYDSEAAAEVLKAAGWTRDSGSGPWRDARGNALAFSLAYDAADPLHAELAAALAPAWNAAGIEAKLEPADWGSLVEKRLAPREFDALLLGWEVDFSRDRWAVWHSTEARSGGSNFCGLKDARVDAFLAQLRESEDPGTITAAAAGLQNRIHDLQPCFFLCGTGRALAFRQGAVRESRPSGADGVWTEGPVAIGPSGLQASRPWWVRAAGSPRPRPPIQQGTIADPTGSDRNAPE